jgi:hypothetical protein
MTTDTNCLNWCIHVEEDGSCCGQCIMTIKPIETLTDEQLECGKGASLTIQGDK